jgi:hypothetical protein
MYRNMRNMGTRARTDSYGPFMTVHARAPHRCSQNENEDKNNTIGECQHVV